MLLDKNHSYVYRVGSDNQVRLHWDGAHWVYEFLAGGVLFDVQKKTSVQELADALTGHGLTLDQFEPDESGSADHYSRETREKIKKLEDAGIQPCPKHGLAAKNMDNTCEACENTDYPDDFKGTEG